MSFFLLDLLSLLKLFLFNSFFIFLCKYIFILIIFKKPFYFLLFLQLILNQFNIKFVKQSFISHLCDSLKILLVLHLLLYEVLRTILFVLNISILFNPIYFFNIWLSKLCSMRDRFETVYFNLTAYLIMWLDAGFNFCF
jgi:hypothetical protein